jgi:hypothetical protein
LVEANADVASPLQAVTAQLQGALGAAGERDPQVEVFGTGAQHLPAYQRLAVGNGVLIWAASGQPEIRIAKVFDTVDGEAGPRFEADHPTLDRDEQQRMVDYLDAGTPLLVTTARMDDVLDPTSRGTVPLSFRTDGMWIWSDAATYYLRRHRLAPDRGLLEHAAAAAYVAPAPDRVAIHRALAVLQQPQDSEPVWTFR